MGPVVDPETGLQYLRARYYDPVTAQFLTVDPIQAVTRAPYAYGNDNPLNYTDPSGLGGVGSAKTGPAPGESGNAGTGGVTAAGGGSPQPPGGSGGAATASSPQGDPSDPGDVCDAAGSNRMTRQGFRNYVLKDANGNVYYSGMFGPGMT